MPKLWNHTIEAHHRDVRDAILDAAARLLTTHAARDVTMMRIAQEAGIGRATLYKYFPDIEAILIAWHERHIAEHLKHLAQLCETPGPPEDRLRAILEHYARTQYKARRTKLVALLHREEHVAHARRHLSALIAGLLREGVKAGKIRDDIPADELATYCVYALMAAADLRSETAVRRLVEATLSGMRLEDASSRNIAGRRGGERG